MTDFMTALGLMSGTSMDGVDAAMLQTDGQNEVIKRETISIQYNDILKNKIKLCIRKSMGAEDRFEDPEIQETAAALTDVHEEAIARLLQKAELDKEGVDLIGFHGQTILHRPDIGLTWQIGDAAGLARRVGIDVVADFRLNDIENGGEGAPFAPLYHAALFADGPKPLCVLNLGGVGNVTYLGPDNIIMAGDTGPGNALLDDWLEESEGFDRDGLVSARGSVKVYLLKKWLDHIFLARAFPKSLDRNDFAGLLDHLEESSIEDGAATLAAFTVETVAKSLPHFPEAPKKWVVTGGGRKNKTIMQGLQNRFDVPVVSIEETGHDGDMIEAEAFAYLAVRSFKGLPLSLPSTTGVKRPVTGGRLYCK